MKIIVVGVSSAVVPSSLESSFNDYSVVTAECQLNLIKSRYYIYIYIHIYSGPLTYELNSFARADHNSSWS
jgi:hypothetical protein